MISINHMICNIKSKTYKRKNIEKQHQKIEKQTYLERFVYFENFTILLFSTVGNLYENLLFIKECVVLLKVKVEILKFFFFLISLIKFNRDYF